MGYEYLRKQWRQQNLDNFQDGLDAVGLVPVIGEAADILNAGISYVRGDNVGAVLNLAAAVPFLGYGAVAGKAGRVFWSGGEDAMNASMKYAQANGMTTLEMTRAGQNLTKLTQGMPWEQAGPMWNRLSSAYAKGAKGPVHVFQNATLGVRVQSVCSTIEYPILKGKNRIIYHNVFK